MKSWVPRWRPLNDSSLYLACGDLKPEPPTVCGIAASSELPLHTCVTVPQASHHTSNSVGLYLVTHRSSCGGEETEPYGLLCKPSFLANKQTWYCSSKNAGFWGKRERGHDFSSMVSESPWKETKSDVVNAIALRHVRQEKLHSGSGTKQRERCYYRQEIQSGQTIKSFWN